jgi:hypothetical protein
VRPHPLRWDAAHLNLATQLIGAAAEVRVASGLIVACLLALTVGGATWIR